MNGWLRRLNFDPDRGMVTDALSNHSTALMGHTIRFTQDEDDAADLVQETMVKAIRFRESFHEGTNLKGWLFTILRNTFLITYGRDKKKNCCTR